MKPLAKLILVVSFCTTIGGWMATAQGWAALATPQAISGLLLLIASHLGAAFGVQTEK
jgi:hypothetical protein